jgi:dihydrodipicolinate synthase/N-acetylneuraminate lyase
MTAEQQAWIDHAGYEDLLRRWRFAAVGDVMFRGDTGDYYAKTMNEKKAADPDGAVAASKKIGWGR